MGKKKQEKSEIDQNKKDYGSGNAPNSASDKSIPEHHRIICLPLDKVWCENSSTELESALQELNGLFSAVGTGIKVDGSTLSFDINLEKFNMVTTRKAGRKSKKLEGKLYEEIIAYRETHTAMETAEWLGLTKQTYYRRMKEWKKTADGNYGIEKSNE